MDQQELQQKIGEYYAKLPKEMQDIFSSMQWIETLRNISTKYSLKDSAVATLGTETLLILLGIIHIEEYESTLKKELNLSSESFDNIMTEINGLVLNPIRKQITEAYNKNISTEEEEKKEENIVEEHLDARMLALPQNIRTAIKASDYQNNIYKIGKENNLTISQIDMIESLSTDVLLGVIGQKDLELAIDRMGFTKEKSRVIINSLNEKVLKNIKEKMQSTITEKNVEQMKISSEENTILKNAGFNIDEDNKTKTRRDEGENENKFLMNSGIKIEEEKKEESREPTGGEMREDVFKKAGIEINTQSPSIIDKKLSGSFQMPSTNNSHNPIGFSKKDPYRMSPEE